MQSFASQEEEASWWLHSSSSLSSSLSRALNCYELNLVTLRERVCLFLVNCFFNEVGCLEQCRLLLETRCQPSRLRQKLLVHKISSIFFFLHAANWNECLHLIRSPQCTCNLQCIYILKYLLFNANLCVGALSWRTLNSVRLAR
jgi:hypothetical protein